MYQCILHFFFFSTLPALLPAVVATGQRSQAAHFLWHNRGSLEKTKSKCSTDPKQEKSRKKVESMCEGELPAVCLLFTIQTFGMNIRVALLFTSVSNKQVFVLLSVSCVTAPSLCLPSHQFPIPKEWLAQQSHMKDTCCFHPCSKRLFKGQKFFHTCWKKISQMTGN